jgi:fructosamine-3-kinase
LKDLLPTEKPSLLHGDLWSGNVMINDRGEPCLIDPAVYFGNREVDLAMTRLFGGFDNSFLESYQQSFPLLPGYAERFDIYNLYPLLVHVNLFGGGYLSQVLAILKRFV